MPRTAPQPALFASDDEAEGPLPGMMSGDVTDDEIEAVTCKLRIFCGPHGFRSFGRLLNNGRATLILHQGRLRAALVFDLGEARLIRG